MKILKALAVVTASALALGLAACGDDNAEYPSDTIEILVPYSAGGATDTTTRAYAAALEAELGTSVIVVNREGGASAIGTTEAAQKEGDGYNAFIAPGSTFSTVPLLQDVSFSADDFTSIQPIADQPYAIVVAPDSPYQTLEDLAGATERITYTTFGNGHLTHLLMANTLDEMGVQGEAVPYNGAADAIQAVTSGQVNVGVIDVNISGPQINQGVVTALAVSSEERHPDFPDVISLGESQWKSGAGYISTLAFSVPSDTPQEMIDVLTDAAQKAYDSDSYKEYREANFIMDSPYQGQEWFSVLMPDLAERAQADFERLGL